MKKLFCLFVLTFLIIGCGTKGTNSVPNKDKLSEETKPKVEEKIPEPYIKALESLNEGDFDLASKYLDLTISRF